MLAVPIHLYYVRNPPGFDDHLARSEGTEQLDPDTFLFQVEKNCYGALTLGACVRHSYRVPSRDAGVQGFAYRPVRLRQPQSRWWRSIDVRYSRIRQWSVVFGSASVVSESLRGASRVLRSQTAHRITWALTLRSRVAANCAHVHQETRVANVAGETGFGGCKPTAAPLITGYIAADFDVPAGAGSSAASASRSAPDFPGANGQLGYLATHTILWLIYAAGLFPPTSWPSIAIPGAPMPGHCAALARTIRTSAAQDTAGFRTHTSARDSHQRATATPRTAAKCIGLCPASASRGRGGLYRRHQGLSLHVFSGATTDGIFDARVRAHYARPPGQESARDPPPRRLRTWCLATAIVVHCDNMSAIT